MALKNINAEKIQGTFDTLTVSGLTTINGGLYATTVSGTTISATTFYGDGSNLSGISTDNFYTTAVTLTNNILYFDRTDSLSAYTVNLSSFIDDTNFYTTGFTYDNVNTLTIGVSDGNTFDVVMSSYSATTLSAETINLTSLSTTTTATTYDEIVLASDNSIMINNQFFIGVNFEQSGVTWNYVAPESFKINSVDNPNSLTYSILHNTTAYTLTNTIALYDDISITGTTSTGFLKLNSEKL